MNNNYAAVLRVPAAVAMACFGIYLAIMSADALGVNEYEVAFGVADRPLLAGTPVGWLLVAGIAIVLAAVAHVMKPLVGNGNGVVSA